MRQKFIVTTISGKVFEIYAEDYSINPAVPDMLVFLQNASNPIAGTQPQQMAVSMFNLKNIESVVTVDDSGRPLHDRKVAMVTNVSPLNRNS